jgi:hypothetical protein
LSLKAHLHNGKMFVKLVGFTEQKNYFVLLKPTKGLFTRESDFTLG